MSWDVVLLPEARDDLKRLVPSVRAQISKGILRVSRNPSYPNGYGKPLGNLAESDLAGLYKIKFTQLGLRVVYALQQQDEEMTIIIISARADSMVYKEAEKRRFKHGL